MASWIEAEGLPGNVRAGTTTRQGGVSRGPYHSFNLGLRCGDDPAAVQHNRGLLEEAIGGKPIWLQQVHGTAVITAAPADGEPVADASITDEPGLTLMILTADCLPVLLAADDGSAIAAAHAGWCGLAAGVLERTVALLGLPGERLRAWLGPAISQAHFEVGAEVRDAFLSQDAAAEDCFAANARGRWQADLYELARRRLAAVGVRAVAGGDRCTFAESDSFYSYRRDGTTGRMASFIRMDAARR